MLHTIDVTLVPLDEGKLFSQVVREGKTISTSIGPREPVITKLLSDYVFSKEQIREMRLRFTSDVHVNLKLESRA